MLAGSGNSAHVFDGFAEKLTNRSHVYGITRRGYGASSRPPSGYDSARLANDVLAIIDSPRLERPILLGHSLGGKELTALATEHPKRLSGLIYIDSTADPTYDWTANTERRKRARGRIVEIQGAAHYMFLSNESDLLRHIRVFINQIH